MKTEKINTLIEYFQSAIEMLEELKEDLDTAPNPLDLEPAATTGQVYAATRVTYSWARLKQWCNERNYQPKKINQYGLMINAYPASAWSEVFGIDITTLHITDSVA